MRILMGMPDERSAGGTAACEPPFVAALIRLGVDVEELIYVSGAINDRPSLGQRVNRVLKTARRLRDRISKTPFDLVHLNTSFDRMAVLRDAATLQILGRGKTRIFLKFHGSDLDLLSASSSPIGSLARRVIDRANGIGLLSAEEMNRFIESGVPRAKLFQVKNAVTLPPPVSRATVSPGDGDGDPHILFISRFLPAKGLFEVIRACGILNQRGVKFRLSCVGDGPARAEAEAEAANAGIGDMVRFTGYINEDEAAHYYRSCAILAFPTYHIEGFPMVIFKAVAAGMPVITTRIRAAADYLAEPENCIWVEPKNPEQLAEKIHRLLTDKELSASISRNNLELSKYFSPDTVAQEYLEVYRRIIGDANGPNGHEL